MDFSRDIRFLAFHRRSERFRHFRVLYAMALFSPLPFMRCGFSVAEVVLFASDDKPCEVTGVEGNKGVKVTALACYGLDSGYKEAEEHKPQDEAVNIQNPGKSEYHHSHKLKGVAKLVILLGEVGDSHESHIKNHVLAQPPYADGEIAENKRADDRQRV